MNPELAALLHDTGVRFVEGDITFKRMKGEMNEWEAAIWYTPTVERVTIARIYTNSCSKEAFTHLFDAFFSTVKKVTGKAVRFKAFDPKGNLYSIHFDMEAAQVQGLGAELAKMVLADPALRAVFPSIDPDKLVQLVLKLCSVHLERSTDELLPLVGQKTVDYLNRIRGLSDPQDIANWHHFCSTHENQKLRDWYAHKILYPWLLPGFNESLSSFPRGYWQQSPSHTNLVESAHVASNKATKINLLPVEAVRKARIFDAEKAASIRAARETCILVNRNNHDQVRMRRAVSRAAKRHTYREEHDEVGDALAAAVVELAEKTAEIASSTKGKKELTARIKNLKSQRKELGRVPRHSTSGRTTHSSSIPHLVGVPDASESEELGLDVVDPVDLCMPPSSPVSSPPAGLRPLESDDVDMFPMSICDTAAPISEDAEQPDVSPEFDLAAMFNAPMDMSFPTTFDFNSILLPGDDGLAAEWQSLLSPAAPPSPPPGWPSLPPVPDSSPARDPSPPIPAASVSSKPATRKCRLSVDEANVVDERRVRTVRVRDS
ncbi:hypothetical protein C8R43DRAFT_1160417 [Mycena crocata]|nr:hypothetical protein C8R43DRAFT_1160417 [Mycena crocata]